MNQPEIKAMQRRITAAGFPLVDDGFWGEQSQAACRAYLRSLMPQTHPWPLPANVRQFYGEPGDEGNLVSITFPYPMFYGGKRVLTTRCHYKIAPALLRVLKLIGDKFTGDRSIMEEAEDYGGCFNFRTKRGASSWSLHAYGAAIDLDADDNTFRDSWPMRSDMPLEIIECFAREGFKSGGAFWGYDAMHFEATR